MRFKFLMVTVVYAAVLLVVSLVGWAVDSRSVAGINPWIKPIKFEVSFILYLLTIAWLLAEAPGSRRAKQIIATGTAFAMAGEITCIAGQAARGVGSHFNEASPFDAAVFGAMGLLIVLNTALVAWLLALYFRPAPHLTRAVVWGIRGGLILFLLASVEGGGMIANRAHTVGAADGGAGLFFLNWSTAFGDLRVAHFLGMHALQILPVVGWFASRNNREAGVRLVGAVFAAMLAVFGWTLQQALAGRPFLLFPH